MSTLGTVFHHANVPFDFRDVFVLSAEIETDVSKDCLKGLKLQISKDSCNAEAMPVISLDDASKGRSHSWNLTVVEKFDSTKV